MSNKTVLIVDDDHPTRRALMRVLKGLGWSVLEACDPVEAAGLIAEYDVILSDWDMPHGGGERVLNEALVPVVVYSGRDEVRDLVDRFLLKPVEAGVLDKTLREAMRPHDG